jgi:hypothetical protein
VIPLLVALSLSFPIRVSPEIPVTTPILGRAPSPQTGVRIASNGAMALAVWNDERNGRVDVTACRIDPKGTPLDPTGFVIRDAATVDDVFWNGSSFAVVTHTSLPSYDQTDGFALTLIDTDGKVTNGSTIASLQMVYGARTVEGARTRLLFLPRDGYSPLARVIDMKGAVIRPGTSDQGGVTSLRAASNGIGFLVIRGFASDATWRFVAETLDRDGNVLASKDPALSDTFQMAALTGDGRGGYALFGFNAALDLLLVRLDSTGVATAPPEVIQAHDPLETVTRPVTAKMTSDGFVASWTIALSNHHSFTYVSHDGGTPLMTFDWTGFSVDTAYDPDNDLVLTSYDDAFTSTSADVFVQKGSSWPVPLTRGANVQSRAAIAAGANGFLASWAENSGTDARLYVRRFSAEGAPMEEPRVVETMAIQYDQYPGFHSATIAASADAYLVVWEQYLARRMSARSGEWLDAAPFTLRAISMASNGSDVLAATLETCHGVNCIAARRVAMHGEPLLFDPVPIADTGLESQPSIASNGKDYLVVWNEGSPPCGRGCIPSFQSRILAMRLGADGSHLDAAPLVLGTPYFGNNPSVAWNGKTYLVTWSALISGSASDIGIAAAYVSSNGGVQQLGTIANLGYPTELKTISHAGEFLIFSRVMSGYWMPDEWFVTMLNGDTEVVVTRPSGQFGTLAAASNGAFLMLTYDRVVDEAGRVGRVMLDPRMFVTRKRAAR